MDKSYTQDKTFQGITFSIENPAKGDYENCSFINCSFAESDLSRINFIECKFMNCDFSMAKVNNTGFQSATFKNCKLLGLILSDCNKFLLSANFDDCILNLSSFYKLKIKGTKFKNCNLREVDFTETDLTGSSFDNCDLAGALFNNTLLEKVDFLTSYNFSIDPEINQIKKAKFSMASIVGLLDKYNLDIK